MTLGLIKRQQMSRMYVLVEEEEVVHHLQMILMLFYVDECYSRSYAKHLQNIGIMYSDVAGSCIVYSSPFPYFSQARIISTYYKNAGLGVTWHPWLCYSAHIYGFVGFGCV